MNSTRRKMHGTWPMESAQLDAYLLALSAFMLLMAIFWVLGVESVYGHPAPFYALYLPAFAHWGIPALALMLWGAVLLAAGALHAPRGGYWRQETVWLGLLAVFGAAACLGMAWRGGVGALSLAEAQGHALAVAVGGGGLLAAGFALEKGRCFSGKSAALRTTYFLLGLIAFSAAFACALAMVRGGLAGIALPYTRVQYEYVGDIGVTSGIRDLFRRYNDISEYLTLHSRAAPPGPIAILWGFTYVLGNDPLVLALCTVFFGCTAVIPFFYWVRELATERVAVVACLLYVFCPGIVLFTATSADILFMPFTMATLFFFERAIRRGSAGYAVLAGLGYGAMLHLKFSLIAVGAYFAFVGLRYMAQPDKRMHVVQTAGVMVAATLAFIGGVWLWSGFDIVTCFWQAKHHFDLDQFLLDQITPRYPGWVYRLLNPLAWFFFAGIPASVLFCAALSSKHRFFAECLVLFLTLVVLNLLCLARGEAERSGLYVFPFILPPAAILLERYATRAHSPAPLVAALGFMAVQCWAVEALLYTYW